MSLRYDTRVRKGSRLARATLSPIGIIAGVGLAGVGLAANIAMPWVVGAALAAWLTSVVLHLRDPELVSSLLAPDFERDLGALDGRHRQMMLAGLAARDRFEQAVASLADSTGYTGMTVRINDALERLYDSLSWAQRADGFLRLHPAEAIRERIRAAGGGGSRLGEELAVQLSEVEDIERRRDDAMQRSAATVTGIETLALKVGTVELESSDPMSGQTDDIAMLRSELDGYLAGLEEIQDALRTLPPQVN